MIHCFYHSADLDGYCSGAIVKHRFPDAVMHPINYGDEFPWDEIKPEDIVYMVDFCLQPFDGMGKLWVKLGDGLHWIDHHLSAIKSWQDYHNGNVVQPHYNGMRDTSKAACELTWEYLFPERPIPLAVELLSLYDSWTYQGHELEDLVLPFQVRMKMEELDPKDWGSCESKWLHFFQAYTSDLFIHEMSEIRKWVNEGRFLLRYDEAQKAKYAKTYAFETMLIIPPYKTTSDTLYCIKSIAVNLGHTNSKVFDSVWRRECPACDGKGGILWSELGESSERCERCKGHGYIEPYDLMISFVRRKDKLWDVSLYSTKPDVDCGDLAKSFGGGGHKGAAGFQCKELPFEY